MHLFGASWLVALTFLVYCDAMGLKGLLNRKQQSEEQEKPRIGHIARLPVGAGKDLYKRYFKLYLEKPILEKEGEWKLDSDDLRYDLPTSDICIVFLNKFISNNYKLTTELDLIIMDSCLGYLYDDKKIPRNKSQEIEALIRDKNLKKIYAGTKLETLEPEDALSFHRFFLYAFVFANQEMTCSDSLQVATFYARSRESFGNPDEDSYVKLLSDVARLTGQKCFKEMSENLSKDIRVNNSPLMKKALNVLEALPLATPDMSDLQQIQGFALKLKRGDPETKDMLLFHLERFANKRLQGLSPSSSQYDKLKGDLCNDFTNESSDIWLKPLLHQDFFGNLEWILFENPDKLYGQKIRARTPQVMQDWPMRDPAARWGSI